MVNSKSLRIILTNDDGIFAEGLQTLRQALVDRGFHPVTVAPDRGASGASRSLSLSRPLTVRKIGSDQFSVDGTPTDCVMMALYEILQDGRRPTLLLSGINHGQNLADDVTYSGTCAAAFEGCMEGIRSVALSALPDDDHQFRFRDHADLFIETVLPRILKLSLPRRSFININFPALPRSAIKGVRVVPLGRSTYTDPIARQKHPNVLGRKKDGYLYWITGAPKAVKKRGTDLEAVEQGYVSVSPVKLDLNDPSLLARARRIFS